MIEASRRGSRAARVSELRVTEAEDDGSIGFTARPTGSPRDATIAF